MRHEEALLRLKLLLEHVLARCGRDEAEEGRARIERPRAELGMGLQAGKVRMIPDLGDLHPFASLVASGEDQTGLLYSLDVGWIDLVTMAMSLPDRLRAAVQSLDDRPFGSRLEDSRSQS